MSSRSLNLSNSGAMVIFPVLPHIGEAVTLQLLDWGQVQGNVRWVRDGKIGINFAAATGIAAWRWIFR